MEFWKDDKVLKEKIFADPCLDSNKVELDNIIVDELLDKQHKVSARVDNCTYEGSGWNLYSILRHLFLFQNLSLEMKFIFSITERTKQFNERID